MDGLLPLEDELFHDLGNKYVYLIPQWNLSHCFAGSKMTEKLAFGYILVATTDASHYCTL